MEQATDEARLLDLFPGSLTQDDLPISQEAELALKRDDEDDASTTVSAADPTYFRKDLVRPNSSRSSAAAPFFFPC